MSTGMDTCYSRLELEESYKVMGLTSLEVEWEPSYEGLEFRSRGRLLTNFPGMCFRSKFMSTSVSRRCHFFSQVALLELHLGKTVELSEMTSKASYGGSKFGSRGRRGRISDPEQCVRRLLRCTGPGPVQSVRCMRTPPNLGNPLKIVSKPRTT